MSASPSPVESAAPEFRAGPEPLDAILATRELATRVAREPDYRAENQALQRITRTLGESPRAALQVLCEQALLLCRAESAGVSIAEREGQREIFRWHATAGGLASFTGGTMPRDFSPCGVVVDTQSVQLMSEMERHFAYVSGLGIHLQEVLLVPFFQGEKAIGTIWIVAHSRDKRFDGEDSRLMHSLAAVTSGIVQSYLKQIELERNVGELTRERALRDNFVAMLSHDLRTPLGITKLVLHMVQAELADPAARPGATERMRSYVERGTRATDRIDEMVRNLLDTVEATAAGRSASRFVHFDLGALLAQTVEDLNVVHESRVVLEPIAQPISGDWDASGVRRVIENLVSNAVKYGSPGTPVGVSLARTAERVCLSVHNEGNPIAEAERARLFDPFKRAERSRKAGAQGWGVGLALVKGVADAHGGVIEVTSTPEAGTTFTLCLPFDRRSVASDV